MGNQLLQFRYFFIAQNAVFGQPAMCDVILLRDEYQRAFRAPGTSNLQGKIGRDGFITQVNDHPMRFGDSHLQRLEIIQRFGIPFG